MLHNNHKLIHSVSYNLYEVAQTGADTISDCPNANIKALRIYNNNITAKCTEYFKIILSVKFIFNFVYCLSLLGGNELHLKYEWRGEDRVCNKNIHNHLLNVYIPCLLYKC